MPARVSCSPITSFEGGARCYPHAEGSIRRELALLLFLSIFVKAGAAAPEPGVCSGSLTTSEGRFVIEEEPEHICIFGGEERKKIVAVCSESHRCEVEGILNDCKDNSASVRR